MTNEFKPCHGSMEMWLICTAVGKDHGLIDRMKKNEDGSFPVIFSVGGVELDFGRVAEEIDRQIHALVTNRAASLLNERYEDLLGEIMDIKERLRTQKETLFKYDWEHAEAQEETDGTA